jgi:hypothetical protein
MKPKKHPSNNRLYGPPPNWDDRGGKLELPAMDATCGKVYGVDVSVTWWQPTAEELAILIRGGQVQVSCIGGQPAMNITAVDETHSRPGFVLPN